MERRFIAKSDIRVEYIDSLEQFIQYAEKIDEIFVKLYGEHYPHQLSDSIKKIGPDSRAIAVWFNDILIGYTGFIQDEKHNRVEFGRLFKHPDYDFNILVMDQYLNRAIEEFLNDKEKLLFATTRLWISSAYMEILNFTMRGSYILPIPISSTWGGGTCYPYFGVYNYALEERICRTHKVPNWIKDLFPKWTDLFEKFSGELEELNTPIDCYEESFPAERQDLNIGPSKLVYIPCINDESIMQYTYELIRKGYTLFAIFPGWENVSSSYIDKNDNNNNIHKKKNNHNKESNSNKENNNNKKNKTRSDFSSSTYVNVIMLGNVSGRIANFPKNFALSAIHYDFVKSHFCDENGIDILYGKPMNELFRRREMGWFRRLMIRFIDRFYQVKEYSFFREHSVDESVSHIFG